MALSLKVALDAVGIQFVFGGATGEQRTEEGGGTARHRRVVCPGDGTRT